MSPDGVCTISEGPAGHETIARMPSLLGQDKKQKRFKEENTSLMEMSLAPTRHWVTCGSKPGFGEIFSFFGPFLLQVTCIKVLIQLSLYIF